MSVLLRRRLAGGVELLRGILPHGLQISIADDLVLFVGDDKRLADERGEHVDNLCVGTLAGAAGGVVHRLRGLQRKSTSEHREPPEQRALGRGEQVVTPVYGGAQRVVTRLGRPAASGKQRQTASQAISDLVGRK